MDKVSELNRRKAMEAKQEKGQAPAVVNEGTSIIGSVMVVGGGIAGMQSALDLANSGYYVYLVEESSAIGGLMSQLDKTFPTNDCAM
jgi:heterodisulfide reductase subunit A-like polyferredoxin